MTNPDLMTPAARWPEVRRRLMVVTIAIPTIALIVCVAATQFVAWRLAYHPLLGPPVFGHIYWPWEWWLWKHSAWADSTPKTWGYLESAFYAAGALGTLGLLKLATNSRHRPRRHEGVHGTARFATEKEIREAGLLNGAGVYVGAWQQKTGGLSYLMHDGPEHVLGIGPLRSGKTNSLLVPTLVSWPGSVITYDTKGEIWEKTAGWRARHAGSVVLRWEPASNTNTVSFNPLAEIRLETEFEFRDAANLAEAIADPKGQGLEGHWEPTAAALLTGVIMFTCYETHASGRTACLADVSTALNNPSRTPDKLYSAMVSNRFAAGGQHPAIAQAGQQQLNRDPRERTSVHSTAIRLLRLYEDPIIARNTRRADFRIADLMNYSKPVSLYIVARGEDELRVRPLVRLFLTMTMGNLCSAPLTLRSGREVSPYKHRMLVALDEFASLRAMKEFEIAMSKCAGYGIKVLLLVQDREQIIDAYGQNEAITSHCHVRSAFAPNNLRTAEWLSEMAGRGTVVVEDVTESGDQNGKRSYSRTYHTVSRHLLTPAEVMQMKAPTKDAAGQITDPGNVLINVAGRPPIMGTQALYFRDPEFERRVAIRAPATQRIVRT